MTDLNNYFTVILLIIAITICSAIHVIPIVTDDICQLPINEGDCDSDSSSSSEERNETIFYGYNSTSRKCEQFIYEGCDGNTNRFDTGNDCWRACYTPLNYFLARVAELISIRVSALDAAPKNTTDKGKTSYALPGPTQSPFVSNSSRETVAKTSDTDDSNEVISAEDHATTMWNVKSPR